MCLHGNYKIVKVLSTSKKNNEVLIDACIADEIKALNSKGIVTLGCCCGHGNSGKAVEHENGFGKWKEIELPPHALVDVSSKNLCEDLCYRVYPYYYANGELLDTRIIYLKSGCLDFEECKIWHDVNGIEFVENLGVIN